MSDSVRGAAVEGEAPINPYSLLEAVNDSSDTAHTGWLIFIGIMSYLLIAVAGVTHKDLLIAREIPLPILQVGIELTRFFLFAPFLLVLFHVGVVTQLIMLARKTIELDGALQILEATDRRTHPLRLELNNFFFVQAIAGPERSSTVNGLLHALTWLTLVVLPVLLLLYIQVAFLPYHDVHITWAHRVALVADIALLAFIGVFLSRPEQSLPAALFRASFNHPITFLMTVATLVAVATFSFLVATIPGERLDQISRGIFGEQSRPQIGTSPAIYGFVLPFWGNSSDGRLFGLFERNLNVTDHDLVNDREVFEGEPTLNLRGRDLRYARLDRTDLHQADMTGANLNGASLVGADLRNVILRCPNQNLPTLTEAQRAAICPSARGANFTSAKLTNANLVGLDLRGATLEAADLTGAQMTYAVLVGAVMFSARLERADLSGGVAMQGANLSAAMLQGADLGGAKLEGADLSNAGLQGATLTFASLLGASLANADLEGASLYWTGLAGADLSGANVTAASLRKAWIWQTKPPQRDKAALADLKEMKTSAPTKAEVAALETMIGRIGLAAVESSLREKLALVLKGDAAPPLTPEEQASAEGWAALMRSSEAEGQATTLQATSLSSGTDGSNAPGDGSALSSPPGSTDATASATATAPSGASSGAAGRGPVDRLTRYLGELACKVQWANGAVATGLVRRVQSVVFTGDVASFYDRLRAPACPGRKGVPEAAFQSLAARVDSARSRR